MFDDIFGPKCERDFYDELCTRGPDAFSNFIMVLKSAGYYEIADDLQIKKDNEQVPVYYKMDSDPFIGYCLIIMNQEFDKKKCYREGCQVDAVALKNLFEKLKYDVQIEWNKEGDQMMSILKKFSEKTEFKNVDSCIVYILSHGGQLQNLDYILGTDLERVYKQDIYSMFNNKNCNLLIGKPKIFFFQACRGELLDYGVSKNSCACDANHNTNNQSSPDWVNVSSLKFDKDRIVEMKYPYCSDMFIVHSSLPDHKSWKNHLAGSWLCQDLVSVVSEHYDKYDLATMMTFVNSKQIVRESADGCKQITHFEQVGVTGLLQFKRSKKGATSSKTS
ncbi:Caspase-2 [Araneus ventricosus]|uniref:Caspase-2 n=1 Tax=Araneus ventricosus TaxID=182803 RepID=A0A4Y2I6R2_ARAVE|nr:Caspase-2 [Araneus ventricosus]